MNLKRWIKMHKLVTMIDRLYTLLFLSVCSLGANAQAFLGTPIVGTAGIDFQVVNYVDWGINGIEDAHCGTKTYDGHQGTDFVIRSFRQMDSGVDVVAAASGVVTFIQDGEFDRETVSDTAKKLGNYVAIKHPNLYYTYYAHLKKNSITVNPGDTVKQGQKIGEVASSGNSSDPHLHFELWYDSTTLVDPFAGPCGNDKSLFTNPLTYDTSFGIWEYGMHHELIGIDDLRERRTTTNCCPHTFPTSDVRPVLFWSQMYGLQKNDVLDVTWYAPDKSEWYSYSLTLDQDWWYYYYWTYINNTNLSEGNWEVVLERNGTEVIRQPFIVDDLSDVVEFKAKNSCVSYRMSLESFWESNEFEHIRVFELSGKTVFESKTANQLPPELPKGVYVVHGQKFNRSCVARIWVD